MNEASIGTFVISMVIVGGGIKSGEQVDSLVKHYDRAHLALTKAVWACNGVGESIEGLSMSASDAISTKGHPEHVETLVYSIRTMASSLIELRKAYLRWHRVLIEWLNQVDYVVDLENLSEIKPIIKRYLTDMDTTMLNEMITLLKLSEKFLALADDLEKATRKIKRHVPLSIWAETSLIVELKDMVSEWNKHFSDLKVLYDDEREQIYALIGRPII